jgi:hypothetical protein
LPLAGLRHVIGQEHIEKVDCARAEVVDLDRRWCMIRSGRKYGRIRALRSVREELSPWAP